jgi:hypothetical protein
MKIILAIAGLALVGGCGGQHSQAPRMAFVDDAQLGHGVSRFEYSGQWEHIRGRNDGRSNGTSSRSRHAGDTLVFPFNGSIVRLYGVRGANGGNATVAIDGKYYGIASFYAPQKQTHVLVFASPPLPDGDHVFGLLVNGDTGGSHRAYVNVDDAEVLHQQ